MISAKFTAPNPLLLDLEKKLSSSTTANTSCQPQQQQKIQPVHVPEGQLISISDNEDLGYLNENYKSVYSAPTQLIFNDTNKFFSTEPSFLTDKSKLYRKNYKNNSFRNKKDGRSLEEVGDVQTDVVLVKNRNNHQELDKHTVIFSCANFKPAKRLVNVRSDSRPISALYEIICKEREIETNMSSLDDATNIGNTIKTTGTDDLINKKSTKIPTKFNNAIDTTDKPIRIDKNQPSASHKLDIFENGTSPFLATEQNPIKYLQLDAANDRVKSSLLLSSSSSISSPQSPSASRTYSPKGSSILASELNHSNNINNNYNNNNNNSSRSNGTSLQASNNSHSKGSVVDPKRDERIARYKEERRRQLDLISSNKSNCDNSDGNTSGNKANRPDSLIGVGRRYITRSSRTPGNSDSSSSPSNTLMSRTNRLKSPLKSPLKNFSPQPSPTSIASSSSNNKTTNKSNYASPSPTGTSGSNFGVLRSSPVAMIASPTSSPLPSTHQPLISSKSTASINTTNSRTQTNPSTSSQPVRTTKASRLRAAALDKKSKETSNDEPASTIASIHSTRYSPKLQVNINNNSDTYKSSEETATSPLLRIRIGALANRKSPANVSTTTTASKKNASGGNASSSPLDDSSTPKCSQDRADSLTNEGAFKLESVHRNERDESCQLLEDFADDFDLPRMRTSTMNSNIITAGDIELSPVTSNGQSASPREERDKSSKRKSNLNRALNEESTQDDDIASRRRRRRELGMVRKLIPTDECSTAIRNAILPMKQMQQQPPQPTVAKSPSPVRNDLSYHMENARKEVLLNAALGRRRASTASPKLGNSNIKVELKVARKSPEKCDSVPLTRSISKENENLRKNKRLSDMTRRVESIRERTKSELAEIKKIAAKCNKVAPSSVDTTSAYVADMSNNFGSGFIRVGENVENIENLAIGFEKSVPLSKGSGREIINEIVVDVNSAKNNRVEKMCFEEEKDVVINEPKPRSKEGEFPRSTHSLDEPYQLPVQQKILKARSHDNELSPESSIFVAPKFSPILRRKSSEEQCSTATNHIVSILKKKDHNESSSASSNASPVTFSSSVVDTPTRSSKRQGILKKRSSLDESRYSRSHSPDERSILVKTARRNSLEEIQHGILKQRSYESSKSDGCSSAEPHGILKKKDSTSTPSDTHSKHVSISQAVILAAAELCKDIVTSENEYDIKPILKTDSQEIRTPKPILKKKHSSETEEIRPILKTSRKSSREESDNDECVKPILKVDSPAKRKGFLSAFESSTVLQRSKSLENSHEFLDTIPIIESNNRTTDDASVSVAERIKKMEKFIFNTHTTNNSATSTGTVPKSIASTSMGSPSRRELWKNRFRTQPITVDEISCLQTSLDIFKPDTFDLHNNSTKTSPRSLSSISPSSRIGIIDQQSSSQTVSTENCLSLSSDSGVQTGKISETSGSRDISKVVDEFDLCPKSLTTTTNYDINLHQSKDDFPAISSVGNSLSYKTEKFDNEDDYNDDIKEDFVNDHDDDEIVLVYDNSEQNTSGNYRGRSNSVRAKANLFQQLEEKSKNITDEEKISSKLRKTPTCITTQPTSANKINLPKESIITNISPITMSDEVGTDFEPSTLPLSQRLKIFSDLSKTNSNTNIPSKKGSSPAIAICSDDNSIVQTTPITRNASSTRLKIKTVGKLVMPSFLSDKNNNNCSSTDKNYVISSSATSGDSNDSTGSIKKIGKIKSPFITNINNSRNEESQSSARKANNDANFDSTKENDEGTPKLLGLVQLIEVKRKLLTNKKTKNSTSVSSTAVDDKIAKYFGIQKNQETSTNLSKNTSSEKEIIDQHDDGYEKMVTDCELKPTSVDKSNGTRPMSPKAVRILEPSKDSPETPNHTKRLDVFNRRNRTMTVIVNTPERNNSMKLTKRIRAKTLTDGARFPKLQTPKTLITKYEDLTVTKDDLLMASKEFEKIFLEATKTPNSTKLAAATLSPPGGEPKKGILKSKSGCVGLFPSDLSSELKNRLTKSTHATVSNLKKSATTTTAPVFDSPRLNTGPPPAETSSESDEEGVDPGKNLAKILRSVSKQQQQNQQNQTQQLSATQQQHHSQHDDTISLVRGLSSLEKGIVEKDLKLTGSTIAATGAASTSEGESSGGREISSIIKNSAVARRRKLNEG